jgi:crotonobetainyl-CoA:carnitine CoA-transferase CaiB-like acyl-CoA transferase
VQAVSGLMSLTGEADGEPYRAGVAVFDVIAGLHAALGVLAALHRRRDTGRGEHVEVSLLASALSGMVNQTSAVAAGGVVPHRMGNSLRRPARLPVAAAGARRARRAAAQVAGRLSAYPWCPASIVVRAARSTPWGTPRTATPSSTPATSSSC